MFLFPIRTDAPVYYWPWVTVLLIVANFFCFLLTGFGSPHNQPVWDGWMLHYGQGLRPLEWISCNFLHFGLMHLVGNMFFLWVFGLVVEGKIGWWRYLVVYFGIGILHAAVEQMLMLGYAPGPMDAQGSGGASGAIFGLMAISMVWAPKNDVTFAGFIFVHPTAFDVSILGLSLFYLGMQIIFAALTDFSMSSEVIHLLGAITGFGVGVLMLKMNWVDCENWDLFNVLAGTHLRSAHEYSYGADQQAHAAASRNASRPEPARRKKKRRPKQARPDAIRRSRAARYRQESDECLQRMRQLLARGKPLPALEEYRTARDFDPDLQADPDDLLRLAQALCQGKAWKKAVPVMQDYLRQEPDDAGMRVTLAGILLQRIRQPQRALKVLARIPESELDAELEAKVARIKQKARRMLSGGTKRK